MTNDKWKMKNMRSHLEISAFPFMPIMPDAITTPRNETASAPIKDGLPRPVEAVIALLGLVIVSPLIALAAVATALTSRGPVIFRQNRMGRKGRPFVLYKMRTMRPAGSGPQVTAGDDARVTLVGKILRKTKVDELPELWNIVKGDMSLIGPRPEVSRYVDLDNPIWRLVLEARPGITDPMTLRLRNEEALMAEVKGDRERFYLETLQPFKLKGYLDYLQIRSWWSDLKVLWQTIVAVVFPNQAPLPTLEEIQSHTTGHRR
jgi:lipopolysaccharide/colanic/teichoic acid biosynthesis glycosyltransferase